MSWNNIKRNDFRARKKSGRARTNALNSMTPQGQAVYCNREIDNAYGFVTIQKKEDKK
tara:strand:+ start:107 stop:280 length:174 start_codon:yes stop_codon:yes gene_type:complete